MSKRELLDSLVAVNFTASDRAALEAFADRNNMTISQALRLSAHLFVRNDEVTAQQILEYAAKLSVRPTHSANAAPDQ